MKLKIGDYVEIIDDLSKLNLSYVVAKIEKIKDKYDVRYDKKYPIILDNDIRANKEELRKLTKQEVIIHKL